jgi:ribose-phosphate pyrophosphokinase
MPITIHKKDQTLKVESFLFPGGEVGVKLDSNHLRYITTAAPYQTIVARLQSSNDVMELVLVTDALRQIDPTPICLIMPYVPYGRQDRVCVPGESFSLKAFAGVINSLNYVDVTVVDPHSDVTGAVFNNISIITQLNIINKWVDFATMVMGNQAIFVSPDAGANKKTSELAKYFNHQEFIRADKLRDLETGKIKETIVYANDLTGRTVIIADDICDGGRTFIELAKVLKAKGANKVVLYVTHGIFSKGHNELLKNGIDDIWTTDSYSTATGNLKCFNLFETFKIN